MLSSLTENHLKILQLLTKETEKDKEGLTFSNFFELCLCEMLVSSREVAAADHEGTRRSRAGEEGHGEQQSARVLC